MQIKLFLCHSKFFIKRKMTYYVSFILEIISYYFAHIIILKYIHEIEHK